MPKKLVSLFICLFLLLPLLFPLTARAKASDDPMNALTESERQVCEELNEAEKDLYRALCILKEEGLFQKGVASLELTERDLIDEEALSEFADGPEGLLSAFGAARDAFMLNNPALFYVDFSKLSLRVCEKNDKLYAYIGNGASESFYAEGFADEEAVTAAIGALEAALTAHLAVLEPIVSKKERIEEVNRLLCESVTVSFEAAADGRLSENAPYIRTAYGALCKGRAVSEGIAAAFKLLMDRLDIPCLTVSGYTVTPSGYASRAYNYVRIGTLYYAIDVTANSASPLYNACFLTGRDTMDGTYLIKDTLSDARWSPAYPPLAAFAYGTSLNTLSEDALPKHDSGIEAFSRDLPLYRAAILSPTPIFLGSLTLGGWRDGAGQLLSENRSEDILLISKRPGEQAAPLIGAALLEKEEAEGEDLLALSAYNLAFHLDGQPIQVPEGQAVTVGLCYPEGETSPQRNTVYKVYRLLLAEDGQLLANGVEEIPSVALDGGLYATLQAGGLYAVAAFKKGTVADTDGRALLLYTDGRGTLAQNGGILFLKRGDSLSLQLTPEGGHRTDEVLLNGKKHAFSESGTVTVSYNDLKEDNLLAVSFLSEGVKQSEQAAGLTPLSTLLALYDPMGDISYTLLTRNASPILDSATTLYLDFSAEDSANIPSIRYEWYKDGELLPNVKGSKLSLKKVAPFDEGVYTVRITLENGLRTRVIESGPITLRVITVVDFFGWILVGLLIFAIPTFALLTVHILRTVKSNKKNS